MIRTTTAICVASRMNQDRTGSRTRVSIAACRAAITGVTGGRTPAADDASAAAAAGEGNAAKAAHTVIRATTPAIASVPVTEPAPAGERTATHGTDTATIWRPDTRTVGKAG